MITRLSSPRLALFALFIAALGTAASAAPGGKKPLRTPNPLLAPSPPTNVGRDVVFHLCGTGIWKRPGHEIAARETVLRGSTNISETESNNTAATANPLPLGFGVGEFDSVGINGSTSATTPVNFGVLAEDNDSIGTANDLGLTPGAAATLLTSGTVGDGAQSADSDFAVVNVAAGQVLTIDTATPSSSLDTVVGVFTASGTLVAYNDDDPRDFTVDSYVEYTVPSTGIYYVVIAGWQSGGPDATLPSDPFTAGTLSSAGSTGTYEAAIGLDAADIDFFSAEFNKGDIVGMTSLDVEKIQLIDTDGISLIHGSSQNATNIHPPSSPLPGGGDMALSYVIPADGTYYVTLGANAASSYSANVSVFRPSFEAKAELNHQYLFLDFDGVTGLNADQLWGGNPNATISPMSSFLAGWSLAPEDEPALIDAITARVQAIMDDLAANGNNGSLDNGDGPGSYKITVLNSKDHEDPFGQPNVSRLIIGGTIDQLGVSTIGIAESIDVGNFAHEESAIILLDLLSGSSSNSLNQFGVSGGLTKIDLVAAGVGNITAHEAAHFLGCWHTDQFNGTPCIIDQGGNLANTVGVGSDGILGTADDADVLNVIDEYNPNEGFSGMQDTRNAQAFGTASGTTPGLWHNFVDDEYHWSGDRTGGDTLEVSMGSTDVEMVFNGGTPVPAPGNAHEIVFYGHGGSDAVTFDGVPTETQRARLYGEGFVAARRGDVDTLTVTNRTATNGTPTTPNGSLEFGDDAPLTSFVYVGFETVDVPVELSVVSAIAVR